MLDTLSFTQFKIKHFSRILLFFCLFTFFSENAQASSVLIVVIGGDNVHGTGIGKRNPDGVPPGEAFPAQLESLLRAKGFDAHVENAGVPHDTSEGMLSRLDQSVPQGTRLVIIDRPNGVDKKMGVKQGQMGYIHEIEARLKVRHISVIILPDWASIPGAIANRAEDGHHFTAEGHARIAAYLLPKVIAMLNQSSPPK